MLFDDTISQKPLEPKNTSPSLAEQASTEKPASVSTEHEEEDSSQHNVKSPELFGSQTSNPNAFSANKRNKEESSSRWVLWIIIIVVVLIGCIVNIYLIRKKRKGVIKMVLS